MPQGSNGDAGSFLGRRAGISLVVFLLAIGFLLLFEHRAHIPGDYYLLGFILVFCVGIHLFMHGGHGGGHLNHSSSSSAHDHDNDRPTNDREAR